MDWCRLSTGYYLDGALLRAGEAAEVLFLRCLAYSGAQESRGRVPKHVLPMLAPTKTKARVASLLREDLLRDAGEDVLIRSWERWQESLDTESERRRKDRERKAAVRAAARLAAEQSTDTSADLSADSPQTVRPKSARIEGEVEEEEERTPPSVVSGRKRPTRRTGPPDELPITPEMAAWGRAHAPLIADPATETARFLDHARANGKTFADWPAAWRSWMGNAQTYAARDASRGVRHLPNRAVADPGRPEHDDRKALFQ